jgi:hypothetical protein
MWYAAGLQIREPNMPDRTRLDFINECRQLLLDRIPHDKWPPIYATDQEFRMIAKLTAPSIPLRFLGREVIPLKLTKA